MVLLYICLVLVTILDFQSTQNFIFLYGTLNKKKNLHFISVGFSKPILTTPSTVFPTKYTLFALGDLN